MTSTAHAPHPEASLSASEANGWTVVAVHGELDVYTTPAIREELEQIIGLPAVPLVALDLSGLAFCDSSGLNTMVRAWKHARSRGGRLVLLRPTPRMVDLLDMTGLSRPFEVFDDLPPATELRQADAFGSEEPSPAQ